MKTSQRPLAGALELVDFVYIVQPNQPVVDQFGTTVLGKRATIAQIKDALITYITPLSLGLGNVDNTSDLDKPISTATQTALNDKQNADSDLTAIAALSPTNDDIMQRKSGAWVNRTIAQLKVDLFLNKGDVGLSNVDNTSDANKPVSSATQTALNNKQPLNAELTAFVALTPTNDDILQRKAGVWVNRTPSQFKTDLALAKGDVGLSNVDNTSDADKPISDAVSTALGNKQPINASLTAISGLTPSANDLLQYKTGAWVNRTPSQFKTDLSLVKGDVGLGNVDNTSDVDKPVSTATQTALNNKQPLDSDLTAIAALTPAANDLIQYKSGAWANRTPSQFKTDLALAKGDVGLGNVDNTSDMAKPVSTAQGLAIQAIQDNLDESDVYHNVISTSGVVTGGVLSLTGGVNFTVSAGEGYVKTDAQPLKRLTWGALNGACLNNGHNFIYIDYNGDLVINSSADTSPYLIGVGYIYTTAANTIVVGMSAIQNAVLKDFEFSLLEFIQKAFGTLVEYGVTLAEKATPNELQVVLSAGYIWTHCQRKTIAETSVFTKLINTSDYGYIAETTTTANEVVPGYYNVATNPAATALVPMTAGYWKKDLFFITPEGNLYYLYAVQEYVDEQAAKAAPIPPMPSFISSDVVFVASIITQTTSTTIANGIYDIRPVLTRLFEKGSSAINSTAVSHHDLIELFYDDHTQYHNDARGDARYYRKSESDTLFATSSHTHTFASLTSKPTTLSGYGITDAQTLDADLTAIAALAPTDNDILQRKSGAWVNRTPSQFKTDLTLVKADVGLSNVDNTSDVDKPISSATSTALGNKQASSAELTAIAALTPTNDDIIQRKGGAWTNRTASQFKTDLALVKADVGLSNVDNTSDVNKPISSATSTALSGKQPIDQDLTDIAALSATNNDFLQRKAGAWSNRTIAQVKTDLGITDENLQDFIAATLVQGNNISLSYNDAGGLLTVAVTPAGSDNEIQYNDAGVLASSSEFTYDPLTKSLALTGANSGINIANITQEPGNAVSGQSRICTKNVAGKSFLRWIGENGPASNTQPHFGLNRIALISPSTGTTLSIFNTAASTSGIVATPALATTNFKTQMRRNTFTTGGGANSAAGVRTTNTEFYRGDAAGRGGFFVAVRFSLDTIGAGNRSFVGICSNVAAPTNIDPLSSTTDAKVGVGINTNTGNWSMLHNPTGSAITNFDLGANFPVDTTTMYELILHCAPNTSVIYYRVRNLTTDIETSGTLSTTLPTNTTFMGVQAWINNNTGGARAMSVARIYIETDN